MATSINSVSNLQAPSASSAKGNASGLADASAQQDRFLKLLVAQLSNQDPMNPMDNAQMTSQIAQINTVSGIEKLNATMNSMAEQFSTLQIMQGIQLVGRDVLTDGSQLSVINGSAKGVFELSETADKVSVQVLSSSGQLLETMNLGPQSAGRVNFTWDASAYPSATNVLYKATATLGGKAVTAAPFTRSAVDSIASAEGKLQLNLRNGTTVGYDAVRSIL